MIAFVEIGIIIWGVCMVFACIIIPLMIRRERKQKEHSPV